ncbi:MAG: hypothetical protein NT007_05040 [Candidatus Kapabacteria bacterium]|nr:hypothetical protein [Candidatus Kapabacteria bacterium]
MNRLILLFILTYGFCNLYSADPDQSLTESAINIDGSVGLNAASYQVSGISPRDRDFRYSLSGAVNAKIFGINFPFSMIVSEQQSAYTQPSNQIGVSPAYKWITLHGGWRSLSYSPFSLAGHTFLGGGIDLMPGLFRISAMYGRFNKANSGADSLSLYTPPSYARSGFAAKLGFGSQTNYFDLIVLKASDDSTSLKAGQTLIKPEENMVLAISGKFNPFSSIFFELDAASSFYTNDIRSEIIADSSLPVFVSPIKSIFQYKTSSQFSTAIQTSIGWRSSLFGIKLAYKRIDPDYKSMGNYFMESDVENILIAPNLNLFDRSLSLTGSFGFQRDNLMNTKAQQSQRLISSAGISFNKPEYGIDLKYSSYGITQYKGLNPLIDSLKIARVNSSFNGSARYSFQTDSLMNLIMLIAGYQTLADLNSRTAATSQSDNYMANLAYQGNLLSSGLNFGVSINYIQSLTSGNKMEFLGPSAQIGKTIEQFNIGASVSYQIQTINSVSNGGTASANIQVSYQISKHHSVNANINIINSGSSQALSPAFTEYRSNVGYIYNF